MKVVKERFTRLLRKRAGYTGRVWQKRFYDFNVCTEKKRVEKLRYMHRNPVKRGLVASPEEWDWSSFRAYLKGEKGLVEVNSCPWKVQVRQSHSFQPMEWVGHPATWRRTISLSNLRARTVFLFSTEPEIAPPQLAYVG